MRVTTWQHPGITPYEALGLKPDVAPAAINQRFRLLSKVWHPDRIVREYPEDRDLIDYARDQFALVTDASTLLRDRRSRTEYDRRHKAELQVRTERGDGPEYDADAWYRLSHFLKEEDLGRPIHRSMAYKQGEALEKNRELSDKQKPYAEAAWELGQEYGFDPYDE